MSYVDEVAQRFLARFPHISVLGPDDYTLIAEWEKQQIPLNILRESIDDAQILCLTTNKKIESVSECEEVIKTNFRKWLESQ